MSHKGEKSAQDKARNEAEARRLEQVKADRARTEAAGYKAGPSGRPIIHVTQCNSRADARNAAQNAAPHSGNRGKPPIHHTSHHPGESPHYHTSTPTGDKKQDGSHYQYTTNAALPSPKKSGR